MPLHGKIVVIKRSGGDGTEFPLTATCMFGRKPDCDIRIQLPQVSKEHCRIDLNENKEVVLTNLSSVNPTRINGEALQQSERLKHGDVITVIDRSFRFEYPPAPTPKKRSSTGGKTETLKVLKEQKLVDSVETGEKKISEVFTDGTNHDNIQQTVGSTVESKEDAALQQKKTNSPFNDLYQMIKKSLDVKTPRQSCASLLQTPASKFSTPKPASVRKCDAIFKEDKGTPKIKNEAQVIPEADKIKGQDESCNTGTPKSARKQRKSFPTSPKNPGLVAQDVDHAVKSETTSPQRRSRVTPQIFTAAEVVEKVCAETPKSPLRRSSRETTPVKSAAAAVNTEPVQRKSPRNSGKAEQEETTKKRKGGKLAADLPLSEIKRKRVSFGGYLSPELFDKRLPPNSPLCKGADPRRSLCLLKPKQSLLRRASTSGLLKPSPKKASPKASSPGKKSPNSRSTSPKATTPAKKSPNSKSTSPKAASPGKKSPSTPTARGRFSVSRISTPSPVAEDSVTDQMPLVMAPPKIPLRRKSMKSTSKKTPIVAKSAVRVIRRSGISRASLKVKSSWADVVKFGQTKAQVAAPAIKLVTKKTTKKTVSKPQTPARKPVGHVSTGHADSPATIVVGRAHKRSVLQPTGAAPTVVTNIALLKKNMKMDEDLTGISEMYKTPVNESKRRSAFNRRVTETPAGDLGTSAVEPSVLNTPEGPGEMVVSPLNVASTVKDRSYNSEAVQRLLVEDQDSSFVSVIPAFEMPSHCSEQQNTTVKTSPVKTPKQKPEQTECLTAVKRIVRTPKQKPEPVEDLRSKILKTPKQKPQQQECLTGVKRIMKTPKQKPEPVEDLRGKLLKTPKQKIEQQECLTGVKNIFQTPQQEAEPLEDLKGNVETSDEPQETPAHGEESKHVSEIDDMKTPVLEKELDLDDEDLQEDTSVVIDEVPQVDTGKEALSEEVVNDAKEKPSENDHESTDVMETISAADKDEKLPEEQPQVDAIVEELSTEQPQVDAVVEELSTEQPQVDAVVEELSTEQPQVDAVVEELSTEQPQVDAIVEELSTEQPQVDAVVEELSTEQPQVDAVVEELSEEQPQVDETSSGHITKMEIAAVDLVQEKKPVRGRRAKTVEPEAAEHSEEPVVPTPVKGRRVKKTETTAPSTVRQKTRNGNTKTAESRDADLAAEESAPKVVTKPRRGKNSKKASDDQAETVATENAPEAESEQIPADESPAPEEKAAPKLRRGRKLKQETEASQAEQQDDVSLDELNRDAKEACGDKLEGVSSGNDETKSSVAALVTESLPEMVTETCEATETDAAVSKKKSVRGSRAKIVELKTTEDKPEAKEDSDDLVVPAPVRGRRGKKTEAVAAPALRQTKTRNAKSRGKASDDQPEVAPEKPLEMQPVTEIPSEAVSDQTPLINPSQELDTAPPAEEAVVKPVRGRKTKQTPVELPEPESAEVSEEPPVPEPQQLIPTVAKPKRGRKMKSDTTEQTGAAEDTVVIVEQESQPPVRAKRGRNAEQEEDKHVKTISPETSDVQEPVKKSTRTRKTKEDHVKPKEEEIQTNETVVPEEAEALPVAEPLVVNEQAPVPTMSRRVGRKAKQAETPVESTEVEEVPAVKPKRGRRGKEASEEAEVPEAKSDQEQEAEEQTTVKPTRARGVKTVKNQVSQVIPAKRARRGATAPSEDTDTESHTALDLPVPAAEPVKRGRRAAAKPTTDELAVSSTSEDLPSTVTEDVKVSKKSVKWTTDSEVFQIPKATPVKAVRGRKSKPVDAESKNTSNDADKPEEKDLSEEVVEAQPVKRARRGAKVAEETVDPKKDAEADTQPKTRRGRSAKK